MKLKDFSNKKCCLNCDGFCWWDGDYCCTKEMKIHQYGIQYYPEFDHNPNKGYFADTRMFGDIDNTMQTPETCEDYDYRHHETYPESDNIYIKEYKKFKEWDRLCKQLKDHVSDPSGIYDNWFKYQYFPMPNLNNK